MSPFFIGYAHLFHFCMAPKMLFLVMLLFSGLPVLRNVQNKQQATAVDIVSDTLQSEVNIVWDSSSLTRLSDKGKAAFYPRMIQLENHTLLLAFSSQGNIVTAKSNDNGRSWTQPVIAAEGKDDVNEDTPELLELNNGSILILYNSRPQKSRDAATELNHVFDIRVKISRDKGESWQNEQVLYKAGTSFSDGCWEPSALQLPDGTIQLFFSNEGIYTNSNEQNISMLQSKNNGLSFSSTPQIISFRKGSRDGMPVPMWLSNTKQVVLAIEDPGYGNFKPYTVRSAKNGEWNKVIGGEDVDRRYALHNRLNDSVYAGAPYLRQLSSGLTLLSYQSTEGRKVNKDNNAIMHVAIGNNDASDFYEVSVPFQVQEGYNALWNSLCVLKGDTVAALTSANAFSHSLSEIWMIKGYVTKK